MRTIKQPFVWFEMVCTMAGLSISTYDATLFERKSVKELSI